MVITVNGIPVTIHRGRQTIAAIKQDVDSSDAAIIRAQKALDTAVSHGVLHRNNAARRKSRLMKALAVAGEAAPAAAKPAKGKTAAKPAAKKAGTKKTTAARAAKPATKPAAKTAARPATKKR